jgi:hypothetical protein
MILILEIFVSFLVISILLLWFRLKSKNKDFYKSISGPPPVPIFGNVLDFSSTTSELTRIYIFIINKQF